MSEGKNPRDTQFAGFAKALFDELPDVPDGLGVDEWRTACEQILAQRAYDLVRHALDCTGGGFYASHYTAEGEDMADVSDLTKWPEGET